MKLTDIKTKYIKLPFLRKSYNMAYLEEELKKLHKEYDVVIIDKGGAFYATKGSSRIAIVTVLPAGTFNDIDKHE